MGDWNTDESRIIVVDVLTPVGRVSHTAQAQLSEWWAHTVGVILNL